MAGALLMLAIGVGLGLVLDRVEQSTAPLGDERAASAPARPTYPAPEPRAAAPAPPAVTSPPAKTPPAALPPAVLPPAKAPPVASAPATPPASRQQAMLPPPAAALPPVALPPPAAQQPDAPGLPPWQRYAAVAPPRDGRPMIAIVIDDVGPGRKGALRSIALPSQVTLAFLPYAADVAALAQAARQSGHELLVHLPMEPDNAQANDPGPQALLVGLSDAELLRRLRWNLDRFGGYVGANNHMGSRFTSQTRLMELVLGEFRARGLMFLDSRTSPESVGARVAKQLGVPETTRDVFLDNVDTAEKVTAQLHVLEEVARRTGRAVAIGHPHDGTLEALERWLPGVQAKGFALVPLTAIVRRDASAG